MLEPKLNPDSYAIIGGTLENIKKLFIALQVPGKPILLEGHPGVGKTSLIENLATITGHPLVRINLSEQTDVSDLFGADLPVDGAVGGTFAWKDGPFLKALKDGSWILLDEVRISSSVSTMFTLEICISRSNPNFHHAALSRLCWGSYSIS